MWTLPNLVLAAAVAVLLRHDYDRSIVDGIRGLFRTEPLHRRRV